jgi:hypothetical protein
VQEKLKESEMALNTSTEKGRAESTIQLGLNLKLETKTNTQLQLKLNTLLSYFKEYSKLKLNTEHLQKIKTKSKMTSESKNRSLDKIYAYYNPKTSELEFTEMEMKDEKGGNNHSSFHLTAKGQYQRTRYETGWDKLHIKTSSGVNPLLQCWAAGYIEGILSSEEIRSYHHNIQVFFMGQESLMKDIKNFQSYCQ